MTWFLLASISAVLSAAAAVLQKKALGRLTAPEFSFVVSLFTLAATMFVPVWTDITAVTPRVLLVILGKSLLAGSAFYCVMEGLRRNQISVALPLLGLSPAVTAVASFVLLGEALLRWEWAGIAMMIAGTYLIEHRPDTTVQGIIRSANVKGQSFILAALGLFALSSVLDRLLVGSMNVQPLLVLFYQHFVFCLIFGLVMVFRKQRMGDILSKARPLFPVIVTVALLTVAYRLAQLEATVDTPVALVLAVKRTSILFASFFGGKLFSDERLGVRLAGSSLIVAAGFLILRNTG